MKHNYFYPNGTVKLIRKIIYSLLLILVCNYSYSQEKSQDLRPYLETAATIYSLVSPNQFFLNIQLSEIITRGRISMNAIESKMITELQAIGIKTDEQLTLVNSSSRYKAFFPRRGKSHKVKTYSLLLSTNKMVDTVINKLKIPGINNAYLKEVYHSNANKIQLILREKAIVLAKKQAQKTLHPLNQKIIKAISIKDSNLADAKALQQLKNTNYNYNHYNYIRNKNLGLKLNKIPIKTTIFVKFEIE